MIKGIETFPTFTFTHRIPSDSNHEHSFDTNLVNDVINDTDLDYDFDPRTEAGFIKVFKHQALNYIYLTAPDKSLIEGKARHGKILGIGKFDFDGCNFSVNATGYLGDDKFAVNHYKSHVYQLPANGTRPRAEMISAEERDTPLSISDSVVILKSVKTFYSILKSDWELSPNAHLITPPFIFQTVNRTFLVSSIFSPKIKSLFSGLYHPFVCEFIKKLFFNYGEQSIKKFDQLLTLDTQRQENVNGTFSENFDPNNDWVAEPYFEEIVEFKPESPYPYEMYNWEIFFHMPFTIAVRLSQNKKFAEAQQWFHYIFNPLASFSSE